LHDLLIFQISILEDLGVTGFRKNNIYPKIKELDLLLIIQNEVFCSGGVPDGLFRFGGSPEQILIHLSHLLVKGFEFWFGNIKLLEN
jgi:hypothetical protein